MIVNLDQSNHAIVMMIFIEFIESPIIFGFDILEFME